MSDWEKYGRCPKCQQTMHDEFMCACGYDKRNVVLDQIGKDLQTAVDNLRGKDQMDTTLNRVKIRWKRMDSRIFIVQFWITSNARIYMKLGWEFTGLIMMDQHALDALERKAKVGDPESVDDGWMETVLV